MSEPFIAEVRMVGFNFAPRGWAFCDGQILPINQNQSLYSLLGTTYGGDGRTDFGLPDLRGRTPNHPLDGHDQGDIGIKTGVETVTLSAAEIAAHTHNAKAINTTGDQPNGLNGLLADIPDGYRDPSSTTTTALRSGTVLNAGGGQAHNNMQPYLAVNFCIALRGTFPSRN